MAVAVAVVLGLISMAIIMYPIASRWGTAPGVSTGATGAPDARAILHKISDLDADFERGTTPEDVYTEDDEIERQIAGIKNVPHRPAATRKALVCSNCTAPHEPNDKFCPHCGTRLIDDGSN